MNSLEVSGYKKLLAAADFQPINWDRVKTANKESIKTKTIKKDDKELFTLTETAINIPINITENDEKKTIFIHRKIDFPINIDSPETSISLSLVLQDRHGQNMLLSKAVYFTVHYNEQGQLIKISNPLGLKFSGTDKNAIGYIEREGNIYTLPVTKGKYEEMNREIEKNQNINKVVEKSIEPLSADFLSTTDLEIIQKVSNTIAAKKNNTYSSTTHMTPNKKANRGKG
ncbi:MAG: Sca4 family protein [Rickettsia endosymbiont of Oxypoda opaca]|nr:Sca4 family protein [Rickettsia endosymbiont of Oxypoda opaca]